MAVKNPITSIINKIKATGRPKARGEGKVEDIDGLPVLGTIARVEELKRLEDLIKQWKLQAVEAYKRGIRK